MNEMAEAPPTESGDRKWKVVYTIVERPGQPQKKFWLRIGMAFPNRDASLNVRLDAMPTNGTLHIRDYEPLPDGRGEGRAEMRASRDERAPLRAHEGGVR